MGSEEMKYKDLKMKEKLLKDAAEAIRVQEKDLPRVVARFKREIEEMGRKSN